MKRNNRKGFTLVELLAAIVIIGLISGVAIVSYQSIFNTAEERYYNSIESNLLLAGNDYFEDHRNMLPTGDTFSMVEMSELVGDKYIDEIKDVDGNICTEGTVYAYRENSKIKYEVCITCSDYKSSGKYCEKGNTQQVIKVRSKKAGGNYDDYDVTKSFNSQVYSNGKNIIVEASMDEVYHVTKYVAVNTKNTTIKADCSVKNNNTCELEIQQSGTYRLSAYDNDTEISSRNITAKIAKGKPSFNLDIKDNYPIAKNSCDNNLDTRKVVINIIKNRNEEYRSVSYRIFKYIGNDVEEFEAKEPRSLRIEENLSSGHYRIDVIIRNYSRDDDNSDDNLEVVSKEFNVTYFINLQHEDGTIIGEHEVVKGYNYDYISKLPTTKNINGQNVDIRWYKNEARIYPSSLVGENCTYTIIGKTSIVVTAEDFTAYCQKDLGEDGLKYNGNYQTLTKEAPSNVSFVNNSQKEVGTYVIKAHLAPLSTWSDGTINDKEFYCKIVKADNPLTVVSPQTWSNVSYSTNSQSYNITPATNGEGQVTYTIKNQPSGNYFTMSNTTITMKGSTPKKSYTLEINANAKGNEKYKEVDKTIVVNVVPADMLDNTISVTTPQTWATTYKTSSQTKELIKATNAQGEVTYSINKQPSGNYFTLSGTTLTMEANTPEGEYVIEIKVSAKGDYNYSPASAIINLNVTVGRQKCNQPTNVNVDTDGKITWTASSNCASAKHQVKIGNGSYVDATSGVNKNSDITATAGSRTISVMAVAPSANYSNSDPLSISKNVYTVTLTEGTGISGVTGAGKYISGKTITIGATVSNGYTFSKWTNTSSGAQISATNAYSAAITSNWSYTANTNANSYTVTYQDNLFAARTQASNGVTATYTENGSYLTLNGTGTTTSFIGDLWNLERRTINSGDKYKITINYVSGTLTCADKSDCTGSNGRPVFVMDLTTNGATFSNRTTSPYSYVTANLPTSGSTNVTFTVDSSRASADGLKYWLWQKTASNATFTNYKVQILITKVHSKSVSYNGTYGTLDTPTKTGYDFNGWYTSITGGTKITSTSTYSSVDNQTLYAQYTSHKLNIQYNGNGSNVTWCSTNSNYSMDSDKYEVISSNRNVQKIGYGQYISYTSGFDNYNNASYTCFAKSGYTAVPESEWVLNSNSSKKYNHSTLTYTSQGVASDAGCDLASITTCTVRMNVNWKSANTVTITKKTYTYDGSGKATSASATSGTPTVTYYSDSSCGTKTTTTNATAAGGTPKVVGTYYAIATVAENDNYIAGTSGCKEAVVINNASFTNTPVVKITGTNTWGQTLTASITTAASPAPDSYTYQWYSNTSNSASGGTAISGATSSTYTIDKSLVGKYIYVIVTAKKANYSNKTFSDTTDATNNTTAAVAKQALAVTVTSYNKAYDGSAHGVTVKVTSSAWDGKTIVSGTSTSYGTTITSSGAYNTSYTLKPTYTNVQSAVTVYYKITGGTYYSDKTGSGTVTITSATLSGGVKITGVNRLGSTLTATVTNTNNASLAYQWYVCPNTNVSQCAILTGTVAQQSTYTPYGENLVGKYLYVEVTATKTGYTTATWSDMTDATENTYATIYGGPGSGGDSCCPSNYILLPVDGLCWSTGLLGGYPEDKCIAMGGIWKWTGATYFCYQYYTEPHC